MNTNQVTLTAEAPSYAPDGSRGYFLSVTRRSTVSGWIKVENDGCAVYATLDSAPWQRVGTVSSPAELTPTWIAEHTAAILRPF